MNKKSSVPSSLKKGYTIGIFSSSVSSLSRQDYQYIDVLAKHARALCVAMTANAQSGHTGGALGCIDILTTLYVARILETNDPLVISNGHVSPAVYALLAEFGAIDEHDLLKNFRRHNSRYEGHVSRHIPGVWYSTGPLGTGISAATGFALAKKQHKEDGYVYALLGDGESEEGQVYEMMHVAKKYHLDNLIVFLDRNGVQLSGATADIMPVPIEGHFETAGWNVLYADGHNPKQLMKAILEAEKADLPTLISCATVMGKGVSFMEKEGEAEHATWHGKAPSREEALKALHELALSTKEEFILSEAKERYRRTWTAPVFPHVRAPLSLHTGTPLLYTRETLTDCRSAYGKALLDVAKHNPEIVALTADLADSVKTSFVEKELPAQHIDCGIAEQQMISMAGGLSLAGVVPFASTFGVFMTSRAKDQARVNDINQTNVKMVATHCGLSVGEDGPTHQAIDDLGSMLGLFNTMVMEPVDPNHCDRMIRYAASHYGNMYIRMGRSKVPVITKEDGTPWYDESYQYTYGKTDRIREGHDLTIIASGPMVSFALEARTVLMSRNPGLTIELIATSSIKQFDDTLIEALRQAKRVVTIEDHNILSGLGGQIAILLTELKLTPVIFERIGVEEYMNSGTADELYEAAELSANHLVRRIEKLLVS